MSYVPTVEIPPLEPGTPGPGGVSGPTSRQVGASVGQLYASLNHVHLMADITGLEAALEDLEANAGIPEAPDDGGYYVRQNGAWTEAPDPEAVEEAPMDGYFYGRSDGLWGRVPDVIDLDLKAPKQSPTFTGVVTTAAPGTASAGFRLPHGTSPTTGITNGDLWTTTSGLFARINGATQQYAPLASPAFTGNPTATTQVASDDSTRIATTAFVQEIARSLESTWSDTIKVTDQTKTSTTTLADDASLTVALGTGKWRVRAVILYNTTAAADFKFRFTFSGTQDLNNNVLVTHTPGVSAPVSLYDISLLSDQTMLGSSGTGKIEFDQLINVTVAGTLAFRWAQNTSDPGNTIVRAGSFISVFSAI